MLQPTLLLFPLLAASALADPAPRIAGATKYPPGNREDGTVTAGENRQGLLAMELSVSSGDSGGGIFRADTNELIAAVCCTSGKGIRTSMYGGSCVQAGKLRRSASPLPDDTWMPLPIPLVVPGREVDPSSSFRGSSLLPVRKRPPAQEAFPLHCATGGSRRSLPVNRR